MTQLITPVMGAFTPVKYSLKLIELLYNDSVTPVVTNTKYEGQIKDSGDRVRVRTAGKITLSAYTKGMILAPQELTPTYEDLIIDEQWYFLFGVDDIDKIQNDINAITEYAANTKNDISEKIDTDVLEYMAQGVNYSNMIGTAYATGDVTITTGTGAVTGNGTTFTTAMVGGIMTCAGLTSPTKSYRVKSVGSATALVIEDLDGSGYTGGAAAGGSAYTIAGATAIALTKANIYQYLVTLSTTLSASLAPREGRFLVANSALERILRQAPEFIPAVQTAYSDVVEKGLIGTIAGFKVIFTELVPGNATTGWWFIAGTKDYCSFAQQIMKTVVIPADTVNDSFVTMVKGLVVWGKKIFAGNRAKGAVLRGTIA